MRKFILCASLLFASVLSFAAQTAGAAKSNSATSAAESQDAATPRAVVTTPLNDTPYYLKTNDGCYLTTTDNVNITATRTKAEAKLWYFTKNGSLTLLAPYGTKGLSITPSTETSSLLKPIIGTFPVNDPLAQMTFSFNFAESNGSCALTTYAIQPTFQACVLLCNNNSVLFEAYTTSLSTNHYIWTFEEYESPKYTIKINGVDYQTNISTTHTPGDGMTYQAIYDALPKNVMAIGGTIKFKDGGVEKQTSDVIADNAVITVNVDYTMGITSGQYYRFYNPNTGEYISDNGSQLVATSTEDATDQHQIFKFTGNNATGYTLENLATGNGINTLTAGEAVTTGAYQGVLHYTDNTATGLYNFTNGSYALLSSNGKIIAGPAHQAASSWILQPVDVTTYNVSISTTLPGKETTSENLTVLPGTKYTLAIADEHVKSLLDHYTYTITVNGNTSHKLGEQIEINDKTTISITFTGLKVAPESGKYYSIFNESNGLYVTQTAAGASLTVAASNQTYAQIWKLEDAGNDQVHIKNALTGEFVQSAGDGVITLGSDPVAYTITATGNIAGADINSGKSWNINNGSVTGGNTSNSWLFVKQDISEENVVSMRNYQNIILLPSQLSYIKTISSAAQVTLDGFTGEASSILDGSKNTTIAPTADSFYPSIVFDLGTAVEDFSVTFTASAAAKYQISAGNTVGGTPVFTREYEAANGANSLYKLTENLNNTPVRYVRIRFLEKPTEFNVTEARVNGVINSGNVPCEFGQAVITAATISGTYDQENSNYNETAVTTLTEAINTAKGFVGTRETFTAELNRVGGYINGQYIFGNNVGDYKNEITEELKSSYNTYNTDKYKTVAYGITIKEYTDATLVLQNSEKPEIVMPINGKAYKLTSVSANLVATVGNGLTSKDDITQERSMILLYNEAEGTWTPVTRSENPTPLTIGTETKLTIAESSAQLGTFTIQSNGRYMYASDVAWIAMTNAEVPNVANSRKAAWKLTEVKEHTVKLNKVDNEQAWATFFSSKRCYLPEDVTARYVSTGAEFVKVPSQDGSYYISFVDIEGNILPAATGVILKSAEAGNITIYEGDVTTDSDTKDDNAFFGYDEDTAVSNLRSALALGKVDGVPGFYIFAGNTYWANKAFLNKSILNNIPASTAAEISLIWDQSTPTGIDQTVASDTETEDNAYYDLSGKRYDSKPTKAGIYIKNRKKIIIK